MIWLLMLIFFLIALYLFAIFPRFSKKKKLLKYQYVHYAHRGLHNEEYPENSLKAFENALRHGFGIELDVQLTKDKEVVICHDFNLKRACGIDKEIDACTYEELCQYSLFKTEYTIPRLKDVLDLIDHQVPIIIEIKQKGINCEICKLTADLLDTYHDSYIVESFNPMAMHWYMKNRPQVIRGQLSSDFSKNKDVHPVMGFLFKHLCANFLSRPDFIAYDIDESHEFSFQLLKKWICSVGWTCKSEKEYEKVKKDFDIIIFEGFIPK
ncbi:glycerophosphodiester phosphodiesterase family protein [Traorella massiliensis]|uniref:glycerophosphodiester phosphodiesterase family protein n=1 Tax=Traorella massiliensis TaxID=1903263 RepID=UPI00248D9F4E|nr:glycerophosphodiester phosphodiesterase family protein [Traorella massiliensis]